MRKNLFYLAAVAALLVLVAAITIAYLAEQRLAVHVASAELVPANALALVELPDVKRTQGRWPKTALHAIWQEPEVRDFMAQPLAKYPAFLTLRKWLDLLEKTDGRQAFVAITSLEGNTPHYLAGFFYAGDDSTVDALLAEPREAFRNAHPAGKSDTIMEHVAGRKWSVEFEGVLKASSSPSSEIPIHTYIDGSAVLAEATDGGWHLVSDSAEEVKAALHRLEHPKAEGSLAGDELYQHAVKPLPADPEVRGFVRWEAISEKLTTLLAASGQTIDPQSLEGMKRQRALGLSVRMVGAELEDTLFTYAPGLPAEEKSALTGLEFTSPETVFFYAGTFSAKSLAQIPQFGAATAALTEGLGTNLSAMLDWKTGVAPTLEMNLPVRDKDKMQQAMSASFPDAVASEGSGGIYYTLGPLPGVAAMLPISPVVLVNSQVAALGLSQETLGAYLEHANTKAPNLSSNPAFQAALASVPPPQGLFAYADLGTLVDRGYGTLRPALALSLAFNPATAPYLDASKLPSVGTLTKHLGATAISRSLTPAGSLLVARGAITLPELMLGVTAAGAATFPTLQGLPGVQLPNLPFGH